MVLHRPPSRDLEALWNPMTTHGAPSSAHRPATRRQPESGLSEPDDALVCVPSRGELQFVEAGAPGAFRSSSSRGRTADA
jgi:hypothetical protein